MTPLAAEGDVQIDPQGRALPRRTVERRIGVCHALRRPERIRRIVRDEVVSGGGFFWHFSSRLNYPSAWRRSRYKLTVPQEILSREGFWRYDNDAVRSNLKRKSALAQI